MHYIYTYTQSIIIFTKIIDQSCSSRTEDYGLHRLTQTQKVSIVISGLFLPRRLVQGTWSLLLLLGGMTLPRTHTHTNTHTHTIVHAHNIALIACQVIINQV